MGGCRAFVAESRDGKLVGRIFIVSVAHLEGIYVDESRRGSALMNLLVQRAEGELRMIGASTAFAYGNGQVMEDYIARLAYLKEPWSVWRKELAPCR
jgi:N-acetylglutamate synthase-like GNAT family acetyltransferase